MAQKEIRKNEENSKNSIAINTNRPIKSSHKPK